MGSMGERIRQLRKNKKLRQIDIAKSANISAGYLSEIEKDNRRPSVETLKTIALAFDCSVDYLLCKTDDPKMSASEGDLQDIAQGDYARKLEVMKNVIADPEKFAAVKLISELDTPQVRKAFDFLSDQKQLRELLKEKGA